MTVADILLVEDHPVVRLGLRAVLDPEPDLRVVGEAAAVAEAVALNRRLRPALVVLPLRLEGDFRGVDLCREIVASPHAPKVLIYTGHTAAEDASASFLSGAHSFVSKGEAPDRLVETIRATLAGQRLWLLGAEPGRSRTELEARAAAAGLTHREQEVLALMLARRTNAQIAQELFIGVVTVKTHVRAVLAKLGVARRGDLF